MPFLDQRKMTANAICQQLDGTFGIHDQKPHAILVYLNCDVVSSGRLCLNCKAVPQPLDCGDIVNCGLHEECYTERYVTYDGITLFNVGCRDTANCKMLPHRRAVAEMKPLPHQRAVNDTKFILHQRAVGDTSVCAKCCNDTDLCSMNSLCGSEEFVSNTGGPLCFSCPFNLQEPDYCHRFSLCGRDHLCGITTTKNILGVTRYRNGCFPKDECAKLPYTSCCQGRLCNNKKAPKVDGNWGSWGAWGSCSTTCGTGTRQRHRSCDNPAPANSGVFCTGSSTSTAACSQVGCQVNGSWANWGSWGSCSLTCGNGGIQTRRRSCTNPAPQNNGSNCSGLETSTKACTVTPCPIDGNWASWGSWGSCSVTCGSGNQVRSRTCTNPAPAHNGTDCTGDVSTTQTCTATPCLTKPQITKPSMNQTFHVTYGTDVTIQCSGTSNPPPNNYVFEVGVSGPMPNNYDVDKQNGILKIYACTTENDGLYRCWAENRIGKDYVFFFVKGS